MSKITCHFTNFSSKEKFSRQAGFTLIELMVVSSIFVLLMATTSSLFINFMVSGAKTSINQKLKQETSDALMQMEFLIRNAKQVTSSCSIGGAESSELSIKSRSDNMITTLEVAGDKIASRSGTVAPFTYYFLTSSYSYPENLKFTCYTVPEKKSQYVSFTFKLKNAETNLSDAEVNQTVYGGVLVRNSRAR